MNPLILIVDDEKSIRHFIKVALETQSYRCMEAENGLTAISLAASYSPDIMILDLGLPDIDGIDVIKKIREWSALDIIVVSARGHERQKVEALDAGADDYLTKPFSVPELLARIRVALRRENALERHEEGLLQPVFELDDLKVDFDKQKVTICDKDIHLTPTEYKLLALLIKHRGKVLTHMSIIKEIWGPYSVDDTQSLRVCMANIRRKIERDPAQPRYIITEVGVGYRFADE
ncbi:response regulator [Mahella australiensis]|uniref:Stage 0 sporulation protein A homolog n=1 Tax=Mahella australiensis (strain DSM 15567 / CIP 107919 / 50-1 BON) TaxID=697281 RepID=F4A0C5_MAHA5|nr:response regulator [Mahella australiensis]AEE97986.1 two component transcriptional regulator, winged helix family [Mahella australiensis 50-1 BON]